MKKRLLSAAREARRTFPEVREVYLVGSLARGDFHGLSDADLVLVAEGKLPASPVDRLRRYYPFFRERVEVALDLLVFTPEEWERAPKELKGEAVRL